MTAVCHHRSRKLSALLFAWTVATAQAGPPPPEDVEFAPPPGASLPADARFTDEQSEDVRLGDLLAVRPAIVVPAYYGCSNLCGIVLQGVAGSLGSAGLHPGRDIA